MALNPALNVKQYNCRTWTRQNGLPVNSVNAIAQTPDGYVWLGTSGGLVRFDGVDFDLVDLSTVAQLRNTTVRSLANTRSGGLWVGLGNSSFGSFDGRSFLFRGKETWGGVNMNVRTMLPLKDGTLWIASEQMAARLTPAGEFEPILQWSPEFKLNLLCAFQDAQGRILLGTANLGIYYWQNGKIVKLNDPTLETVNCIAQDSHGDIWFGSNDGVRAYDSNLNFKSYFASESSVSAMLVDREDVLWIGTSNRGIARFSGGHFTFFGKKDGLANDYINAIIEDSEGSLWIGTTDGISELVDVKFPTLPPAEDVMADYAQAVCASRRGGIWIGSNAGVTYFDGTYKTYSKKDGLPDGSVKRVFEASNGDVYFVSGVDILSILSGGKVVASYRASTLVVGMAEDAHGVVVSVGGDIFRVGKNGLIPYPFVKYTPLFRWILNLAPSKDGSIWVACQTGIFRIKDGLVLQSNGEQDFSDARVQYVWEDSDGILWAALFNGIARLKDGEIRMITRKNGILDDNIYAIVPDNRGDLWVDTGKGIFRVSRKSINDCADGKTTHVDIISYASFESLNSADKTNGQEHVGCKSLDGRIWFPSAKGVVLIDPAHIPTNRIAPPVHIEHVLANRKILDRGQDTVAPGAGELEFHFTAPSFIAPQKTLFRYRLKGYDDRWVEARDRRVAFYTNLKPGQYTFSVVAANADGVWNETGESMDIRLLPHFYQTVWFYAIWGGATLATLSGLYYWRAKHLKHKHQALQNARDALETEVIKRTAELATVNSSLKQEVEDHKRAELEIERVHRVLVSTSRQAGMAEVATSVLHNVGNVLNSVNVSSSLVLDQVTNSSSGGLAKMVTLLREQKENLGAFVTDDPRGKQVVTYLAQLSDRLAAERGTTVTELELLRKNVEHIKEIVAMQQSYATVSGFKEIVDLQELVEDSLRMNSGALDRHGVKVIREYQKVLPVNVDKHKVLQILINLVGNAKYACHSSGKTDKRVTVRIANEHDRIQVSVEDNGVGISPENLTRIFNHGFTTRKDGHGFGLHSGALAAREMGGTLSVRSEGLGQGAVFTLELPGSNAGEKARGTGAANSEKEAQLIGA